MRIKAEAIRNMSIGDVWGIDDIVYEVEYPNGDVVTTHKQGIIFNRYCWLLYDHYPKTILSSKHDVMSVVGDGFFNISTPVKVLESVFNHICKENLVRYYKDKEPLLKEVYNIYNRIFNEIVHGASEKVTTIDATDFVEVMNDEVIDSLRRQLSNNPETIDRAYKGIREFVSSTDKKNSLVAAYRAKAINDNQANQCIGPRGFVTDLDRTVYRQSVHNGFIRGMGSLYEIMAESRTAAKSLNATETHIRTSEYTSRRIQLLAMSVTNIVNEDCRSEDYLDVYVDEKYLPNLKGKWYVLNKGDKLKYIEGNESELVGKVIKMRSVFGCKTLDKHHICTKCLGRVAENIKENSNIGYTSVAYLMEKLTQAILSTKHLTHSVKKSAIELDSVASKYLISDDDNNIYFRPNLNTKGLKITLPARQLVKLVDVLSLGHTNVALNKVGDLETVVITTTTKDKEKSESVVVSYKDRFSNITRELLKYMKASDLEIDQRGNFTIDMSKWDKKDPVFNNPLKEANVILFINKLSSMIEFTKKTKDTLEEHFFNIVDTVYSQLQCNITMLEVIVYATTSFNKEEDDYRLGRGSPNVAQTNRTDLFGNRSMGQLFVYERQTAELLKRPERAFSNYRRTDHPLDVLFTPAEIVK